MIPNAGTFDFSPAVGPSISPGDAIILISDMMMEAGFEVWYPFFWSRTATALKEQKEKRKVQANVVAKREEVTPVAQRLRFSGLRESNPYEFKAMEALEEFRERERIQASIQKLAKEEDLDSLFDLDTGEVRSTGGQALQIQTISNWEPKPFSNKDHSGAKARDWLKKFNMYVEMANLGKIQKCQLFEMYAKGEVLDWYKQLVPGIKKDWNLLSKFFVKQFCEDEQSSMKRYYSAKQGEDQSPQQYFWKLNSMGKKAGKKIMSKNISNITWIRYEIQECEPN